MLCQHPSWTIKAIEFEGGVVLLAASL